MTRASLLISPNGERNNYVNERILVLYIVFIKNTIASVTAWVRAPTFLVYTSGMSTKGKLLLLIGPSGVGKSVILKKLRQKYPELVFPKSATTRAKRDGEGNDLYHFVSNEDFDELEKNNQLLEWAVVHGGARYGTLVEEILPAIEQNKIVVREVDVQGFDSIRSHQAFRGENAPYTVESIFILPESKQQLMQHITERAPISQQELRRREASMEKELSYATECDHQIVNKEGKLHKTLQAVEQVILSSS